jgi:hypothetical protein
VPARPDWWGGADGDSPRFAQAQTGHGNGEAMQSLENDEAVSYPSHSRLEDADEARVSHIPTTTATRLDKKDKRLLLHQSIGLSSSAETAGRIAPENATCRDSILARCYHRCYAHRLERFEKAPAFFDDVRTSLSVRPKCDAA